MEDKNINNMDQEINSVENENLEDKTAEKSCETLLAEQKDSYLRIVAEKQNEIKRIEKDAENKSLNTIRKIMKDLIPISNDIKKAAQTLNDKDKKGIELIQKNINHLLIKNSIQEVEVKVGDEFNAHEHQAIAAKESEEHESGMIIEVLQNTFKFKGEVIVPALVITAE
jgi:molecular chaperone GrpE